MDQITLIIVSSVAVFLLVVLLLAVVLPVTKSKLIPSGNVHINVNDVKGLGIPTDGTLLNMLQNQGIFLSSACGGGGSCGQCCCCVVEGGGEILITEKGSFSRKKQTAYWRLDCRTKVREDLKVIVPESVLDVKEWECEVVSNRNAATFIKEFVVKPPEGEHMDFKSGSYAQTKIPKYEVKYSDYVVEEQFRSDWDKSNTRSLTAKNTEDTVCVYSTASHPAEGNTITPNIRIATLSMDRMIHTWQKVPAGTASSYIFSLKPGDKVTMSSPYGGFHIHEDSDAEMFCTGGGADMAPLRTQLLYLFLTEHTTRKVPFWYGVRLYGEIFYEEDFRVIEREFSSFSFHIAPSAPLPEDNWIGLTGFIHQAIYDSHFKDHEAPEDIEYYMCGPGPMPAAVIAMLGNLGVPPEQISFGNFG